MAQFYHRVGGGGGGVFSCRLGGGTQSLLDHVDGSPRVGYLPRGGLLDFIEL